MPLIRMRDSTETQHGKEPNRNLGTEEVNKSYKNTAERLDNNLKQKKMSLKTSPLNFPIGWKKSKKQKKKEKRQNKTKT